ncbi:MAG: hypothetical protein ACREXK_02320 [Gammaproteobacteria bacterium]
MKLSVVLRVQAEIDRDVVGKFYGGSAGKLGGKAMGKTTPGQGEGKASGELKG